MTESREVLRLTMAVAEREHRQDISTTFVQCSCGWVPDRGLSGSDAMRQFFDHVNDARLNAILAHPVAVLDLLENAPCETCGGKKGKFESRRYGNPGRSWDKQVFVHCPDCGGSGRSNYVPVFASRVAVPEPSEGETP